MYANKDNWFSKIETQPDGRMARFSAWTTLEEAMIDGYLSYITTKEKILSDGWTFHSSLETLTVGEKVKDGQGNVRVILIAEGIGEWRTYLVSTNEGEAKTCFLITAKEMKDGGWKVIEPEPAHTTGTPYCGTCGEKVK